MVKHKFQKNNLYCRNRLGSHQTEETKRKIREKLKGRHISPDTEFKKGHEINKGEKHYNYIDGRSKMASPARYGDDWFKIRLLIYARDNFTCQECGITMNEVRIPFHVHHKIPFLISFDNSLNNLVTLCPPCHRRIEAQIMRELKIKRGV